MSTIRDVAREAGVSIATVSHVLNGTRPVHPDTAARVQDAVKALHYRPMAIARNLRRGQTTTLGLLVSDIANPFFPEMVTAFEETAIDAGWDVILGNTGYDRTRCRKAVEQMLDASVRGVAVLASEIDPEDFQALERRNVPIVFLDRGLGEGTAVLEIDYATGVEIAVDHLFGLGHRHIAFVGGPEELYSAQVREAGFRAALRRRDELRGEFIPGDFRVTGGRMAAERLLEMDPRPTGVVCGNDITALAMLSTLSQRGVAVPDALSVVGFDGIGLGEIAAPPLTTVSLELGALSCEAFRLLQALINDEPVETKAITPRLLERASTGSPVES